MTTITKDDWGDIDKRMLWLERMVVDEGSLVAIDEFHRLRDMYGDAADPNWKYKLRAKQAVEKYMRNHVQEYRGPGAA